METGSITVIILSVGAGIEILPHTRQVLPLSHMLSPETGILVYP